MEYKMSSDASNKGEDLKMATPPQLINFFDSLMMTVATLPQSKSNTFQNHIEKYHYKDYNQQKKNKLDDLVMQWSSFPIKDIVEEQLDQESIDIYRNAEILSAKILKRVKQLVYSVKWKKDLGQDAFINSQKFQQFLSVNQINLSLNRYLWTKESVTFDPWYNKSEQKEKQIEFANFYKQISEWAVKEEVQFIYKLQIFLEKIGLAVSEKDIQSSNTFMQNMERISNGQQRQLYLTSWSCVILDNQIINQEQIKSYCPNYSFYKNKTTPSIRQQTRSIDQLHCKFKDYNFLQSTHDYIQWMFPNHYGSAFNSRSKPLNYIQSYLFLNDLQIGLRMLKSIYIFFDFMGIQFNIINGQLRLINQRRLQDVILRYTHNHLRIMRILACLSVTGFRKIAINLINLLDTLTQKGAIVSEQRSQFERSWFIYHDTNIKQAKRMCFLQTEQFPADHPIIKIAADNYEQIMTFIKDSSRLKQIKQQKSSIESNAVENIKDRNEQNIDTQNNANGNIDNADNKHKLIDNNDVVSDDKTIKISQANNIDNDQKDKNKIINCQQRPIRPAIRPVWIMKNCSICNRQVKQQSLLLHQKYCLSKKQKRPIYDSKKHRKIEEKTQKMQEKIETNLAVSKYIQPSQPQQKEKQMVNNQQNEQIKPN